MPQRWKDELTDQLCDAFLTLKDRDELYDFLEDVATVAEIRAFAQRLQVAKSLLAGDSYPQISKSTGASTATISRVKKSVEYGRDGFKLAFDRMEGAAVDRRR